MTRDERRIWQLWRKRVTALEADIARFEKESDPDSREMVRMCKAALKEEMA